MAEFRLTFGTYVVASTLSVLALLLRTWYVHEELYTVVAVLTTQKVALAILYNFAFMLFVGFGKVVLHVLLGQLRDLEVEQVLDSGRGFLLDTVLFLVLSSPTLDGADVSTYALAKFLLLVVALKTAHLVVQIRGATVSNLKFFLLVVALKTAHLVVQIRGATMFEVGHPRAPALMRVCVVLSALLSLDVFAVHFFFTNASRQSTFYLWLLFELKLRFLVLPPLLLQCLGMLASCAICIMKFGVHLVDLRLDNGWTSKSAVIFYLELMHDVTSLVIFLLFMAVFFITQPSRLPLYMTADIIHVVKALYKRILSLKKYRSLTRNLETRFPDATPEELEAADTCIICRDFLFDGSKKLPCSHIFHIDCLRSWLVQQQSCPTCRADIPTDDNAASAAAPSTSADGSGSPAGSSRAPPVQQQQQRSSGSASRGQQQQQQRGGVGASASPGSGGAAGSAPNARPAAAGREEKRIQSSEGHDRISAVAAVADATPASVEAVAGQRTRMPAVGVAGNLQNSARYVNNAHVNGVSDPLALLDMRVRRSSGRLEAAAAAALAAAASAAAVAPSARTSAPTSRRRVDYADELEAALRLRATQAEAVITGALAQTLAMTYQMCDLYRLHASLWTVEAQRAQLEACHQLLQRSELRRSSAVVTYADAAPAEGIRRDPTTRFGAAGTADPAADALPPRDVPAPPAAALAPSVVVSRTSITVAETHRQGDLATAKGASGIDAALKRNEKKPYVSCPSVVVEGASRNTPVQTTSSSDLAVGDEGLGENNVLLGQAATPAAVGTPTRVLTAPEGAEAAATEGGAAGAVRRAEVGRAAGTEMRQNSGREYVVVCPSHLVHQAIIPYFSPYNEIFVVPFAHGGNGRLVDDGVRVKSSADGNRTVISDTHRSNAGICISNANGSLAPLAAPSASSVVPPGISETYDDLAAAGQYFLCGRGNATSAAWQSLRGLPCSALPPLPPFAGFPSVSGLLPGLGEAPAAQQRIQLATNSHLAAAVEQGMTRMSESSGDVKLPPFAENPAALRIPSYNVAAHVANGTGSSAGGEEQVHNHFGNSSHTALAADGLVRPAPTDIEENAERSSSTAAETLKGVTSAMAAELERLRREQHRRWKRGGTASNNSSDV